MSKNILYRYNPETDDFERVFPSIKSRFLKGARFFLLSLLMGVIIFIFVFYVFETPTEENLKAENKRLKQQYGLLHRRMETSQDILARIRERDENFYRVMLQMEPQWNLRYLSGLENEERMTEISKIPDYRLVDHLDKQLNLFERSLFAQIESFDLLQQEISKQKDKISHIPAIIPIKIEDYTMSSGYGYRLDPIYGSSKFHEGIDFAAHTGVEVFATADGKVRLASRQAGYGNCVEIDHGYNYMSRYAHLSEILVREGEYVKRGQLLGKVGSTGKSTGPHLHYEVRFKEEPQNPVNYYFMDLTPAQYAAMIQEAENAAHVMD